MLSANFLLWSAAHCLCHNVVLPDTISYEEGDENQREPSPGCMVGDHTLPIENSAGASLLQLQLAAEHWNEGGQCLMTIFLFACSE